MISNPQEVVGPPLWIPREQIRMAIRVATIRGRANSCELYEESLSGRIGLAIEGEDVVVSSSISSVKVEEQDDAKEASHLL